MKKSLLLGSALLGMVLSTGPAWAQSVVRLGSTLAGANETGGGDSDGTGTFSAEIDPESGDLCFTLAVDKIGAPTAAHVHLGAAGADGDPVAAISVTGNDGDECVALQRDVAKAIVANPAGYYVNVHTGDFPKGAIRGQLAKKD
jgi:hypothetical protein